MLRDHRRLLVTFADKSAVREHVSALGCGGYLPEAVAVLSDPTGLTTLDLPDAYVVKPTHGSGAVVVVSPAAPGENRLPGPGGAWVYCQVRPEVVDRQRLVALGAEWLDQLYGQGPNREWAYGPVPRQILVEELLVGPDGGIPDDYKLFVFHQQVRFIQVDTGRFGSRTQDFYSPGWEHLDLSGGPAWAPSPQPEPERLDELITLAQTLSAGTDFVRVDLYVLPDRIVFGELTSYPAGGHSPFYPGRWNLEFGRHWKVPQTYR